MNYRLVYFLCGPANAPGMENEPQAYHLLKKVAMSQQYEYINLTNLSWKKYITSKFEIKGLVLI